jgi:hypothetical protein
MQFFYQPFNPPKIWLIYLNKGHFATPNAKSENYTPPLEMSRKKEYNVSPKGVLT